MRDFRVLINDEISERGVKILKEAGFEVIMHHYGSEELKRIIKDFDALIVRSATKVTREIIEEGSKGMLKVIGRAGVGVDNIDVNAATEKGILVVNAPTAATRSVAELTLAFALALARDLVEANNELKVGMWTKKKHMGFLLYGKTWGVIGYGRIGREVAKLAKALGMNVIAYDPYIKEAKEVKLTSTLEELLKNSDIVSIHVPLTPETRGLIGEKEIKMMKKGAILINTARGGIVDEKALAKAVEEGYLKGAGVDVFEEEPPKPDNPLLKVERIYVTPHIGASTVEAQDLAGEIIAEQIVKALRGEIPEFIVNKNVLSKK
ncbi:MAG: hydroxyacid dehydrogenase [Euryarchaeota archaeon]|nr:hydroxyacid dehydrogenase [Euryarchaeota archaeon]